MPLAAGGPVSTTMGITLGAVSTTAPGGMPPVDAPTAPEPAARPARLAPPPPPPPPPHPAAATRTSPAAMAERTARERPMRLTNVFNLNIPGNLAWQIGHAR